MDNSQREPTAISAEKRLELGAFLLLTVVLAPVLAVLVVGGYGFLVWISQLLMGPPSY